MDMQELKNLIYQGEKVDVECKKHRVAFQSPCMKPTALLQIPKVER